MYERFFQLTADPFRLSPDHRFCYRHPRFAKAKAYMAYAFRRAEGFVMVTGPPGTGKTTLIGDVLDYLAKENVVVANLVSTQLAADDLLRSVAFAFEVDAHERDKSTLLENLRSRFMALRETDGRALLIVDEAQDLSERAMEELRLLTNLQEDGRPLLQIFLLGQPELGDLVRSKALEPVHQRIVAASHLEALQEEETTAYVQHRLKIVGWKGDPELTRRVYVVIYRFSEGIPRRINLICNRLFLNAFVEQRHKITIADAKVVVQELHDEQLSTRNILGDTIFAETDDQPPVIDPVAEAPVVSASGQGGPGSASGAKERARFEAQEISLPAASSDLKNPKKYMGPEQRRAHRRGREDRRKDIRFEMDKDERRKGSGRRRDDKAPDFW
jgi:type II secretory pathway predicted ATPase ExeA